VGVLLLSFFGCGVSTSSSPDIISNSDIVSDDNSSNSDVNTTIDDVNTTVDGNVTDGSGDGLNNIPTISDLFDNNGIESDFDTTSATSDSVACELNGDYTIAFKDSSFDPLATENIANGLELGSMLNYNTLTEQTEVAIFAPKLTQSLVGKRINVYGTGYWLGFDMAWVSNANKTVYIRTPKDKNGYYGCYRYVLNSSDSKAIVGTKVYR
jgi:hypothetical protein